MTRTFPIINAPDRQAFPKGTDRARASKPYNTEVTAVVVGNLIVLGNRRFGGGSSSLDAPWMPPRGFPYSFGNPGRRDVSPRYIFLPRLPCQYYRPGLTPFSFQRQCPRTNIPAAHFLCINKPDAVTWRLPVRFSFG